MQSINAHKTLWSDLPNSHWCDPACVVIRSQSRLPRCTCNPYSWDALMRGNLLQIENVTPPCLPACWVCTAVNSLMWKGRFPCTDMLWHHLTDQANKSMSQLISRLIHQQHVLPITHQVLSTVNNISTESGDSQFHRHNLTQPLELKTNQWSF